MSEKLCGACLLQKYKTSNNQDEDCDKCLEEKKKRKKNR
ncbi:hypothetical protein SAMN04488698_11416 [Candidatus Frackibacter sp. WG12]|nr:hypothetical protein SAMN04515661_106101 [Candidatus Frackibacter sp. WG11]SEM73284.1 hypothetical protein SAMN04488698_11416 [Candidatus Frackibacter sp. WG12]SFL59411.1 hypothetical protein SAMN04488699_106100 [Candidatus Frackibacter sp. WG13]